MNKKWMLGLLVLVMVAVAGCGNGNTKGAGNAEQNGDASTAQNGDGKEVTLKVATLIPPMTDILELVKPLLKEDGINLELVVLSDNVQPNDALANKEVDANFFNMCLI